MLSVFFPQCGISIYVIFSLLHRWDNWMQKNTKFIEVYIKISESTSLGDFIRSIRKLNLEIKNIQLEWESGIEEETHILVATLKAQKRCDHAALT